MRQHTLIAFICLASSLSALNAAEFPEAEISNGAVRVKLYLPSTENGYYRGSRFDWSGVVASLSYKGHEFFGQWFERYEPTLHDAITGPVDEFRSEDGGLGYGGAKSGGTFVKIGVGVLRKPDDEKYSFAKTFQIVNPGRRVVRPERDRVEFLHELNDGEGYAYIYKKTVRLDGKKPVLILEHNLKNTGRRTIETSVYNHDFFVIDGQPTGPDVHVQFTFPPHATDDLKGLAEIRGNELTYIRELQMRQSAASGVTGFGSNAKDNDVRVENRKTGAGVREVGDHPISKLYFWSIRTTVCPEAYIDLKIEPGHEAHWRIAYYFYTLDEKR